MWTDKIMNMKKYLFLAIAILAFCACNKVGPTKKEIKYKVPTETEAIDLGLPSGTLWAPYNIGAGEAKDCGDYFAWGETSGAMAGKKVFSVDTYKWCDGDYNSLKKYNTDGQYGVIDNLTELELEDDAANVCWGGNWKTPTFDQMKELFCGDYTDWNYAQIEGVYGRLITSKSNSNMIFMPCAGCYVEDDCTDVGEEGVYWTSSLSPYNPNSAWSVTFTEEGWNEGNPENRYLGFPVRAVINK